MTYRDQQFCSAACLAKGCPRQFTEEDRVKATKWWGGPDFLVAMGDMSADCAHYLPMAEALK